MHKTRSPKMDPSPSGKFEVFAPRAPSLPRWDVSSRELWRRGNTQMWPDVIPPKTSPLAVGKLDTTICDRLNFSLASTRQFATQEVVDSTRATLRKFEREAHCKPSESHGVRAARSVVQSLDPFEAGFASVSASKWRQEWEKRVLERTSLRFGGAKASRSSRDSRTDALTGLNVCFAPALSRLHPGPREPASTPIP